MNKFRIIACASAVAMLTTALSIMVEGDAPVYDSAADPLVSLSYINEVVIPSYDAKLAELNAKLDTLVRSNTALSSENTALKARTDELVKKIDELEEKLAKPSDSGYSVVLLTKGQKLMAETPCEIILRSGSAIAVSITTNGLNDITDGTELSNAVSVPLYHQLIVPRGGDGRGIQITGADAYVMVRGGYNIVN